MVGDVLVVIQLGRADSEELEAGEGGEVEEVGALADWGDSQAVYVVVRNPG